MSGAGSEPSQSSSDSSSESEEHQSDEESMHTPLQVPRTSYATHATSAGDATPAAPLRQRKRVIGTLSSDEKNAAGNLIKSLRRIKVHLSILIHGAEIGDSNAIGVMVELRALIAEHTRLMSLDIAEAASDASAAATSSPGAVGRDSGQSEPPSAPAALVQGTIAEMRDTRLAGNVFHDKVLQVHSIVDEVDMVGRRQVSLLTFDGKDWARVQLPPKIIEAHIPARSSATASQDPRPVTSMGRRRQAPPTSAAAASVEPSTSRYIVQKFDVVKFRRLVAQQVLDLRDHALAIVTVTDFFLCALENTAASDVRDQSLDLISSSKVLYGGLSAFQLSDSAGVGVITCKPPRAPYIEIRQTSPSDAAVSDTAPAEGAALLAAVPSTSNSQSSIAAHYSDIGPAVGGTDTPTKPWPCNNNCCQWPNTPLPMGEQPECVLLTFRQPVVTELLRLCHFATSVDSSSLTFAHLRNSAYWWWATQVFGVRGKFNRMCLPPCLLRHVRRAFPEPYGTNFSDGSSFADAWYTDSSVVELPVAVSTGIRETLVKLGHIEEDSASDADGFWSDEEDGEEETFYRKIDGTSNTYEVATDVDELRTQGVALYKQDFDPIRNREKYVPAEDT